ncbi:MAG: hypothetical protein JWM88_2030 [Verrucomicrobia bacterium]|nr:hypothetical protein [Verrucomicrobiota bacterium]
MRTLPRSPLTSYPFLLTALCFNLLVPLARAASPLVPVDATTYKTEHCLFIVDASVQWSSPTAAYADLYATPFTRLGSYFGKLTAAFPAGYFSVCYMANTGDLSHVPNYIDRIYKASGISTGVGSSGIGNGDPAAATSFATVDFCRYNLTGALYTPVLAVYDHELGHAWGCQFFNNVTGVGPGILSNGHWLSNTTIDCQMGATYSSDGGATVNKLYGDPANGFRYQRVDNLRSNDYQVFSDQTLYLIGVSERFPTTYALNSPVYNADLTVSSASVETYDHAAALARYGARNPGYQNSPKQFKLGFVYIARDAAEVNAVYQAVEQSVDQFCNGEDVDPVHFRFQTPFLVDTHFRASVDGRLADLDGNATPVLAVTDPYTATTDGSAVVNFTASDPDGPAPVVSLVPASTQCAVVGHTVQITALPDGVHFFSIKAVDGAGKKAFGHFVVEVQRPVTVVAVTTQPATQTVVSGNTASFSVAVTGGVGVAVYQWFHQPARTSTWNRLTDGGNISGATAATLAVASSTAMNGDQFLCMVTNGTGEATSHAASLVVNEAAPVVTLQPADTAVAVGNVAHFSVAVTGTPVAYGYAYYQWQKRTSGAGVWNDVTDGAGIFNGATTASLTVYGTVVGMTGDQYRCLVSNTGGSTTTNAATLTVNQPPTVTTQPVNATASVGQTVSFTVVAAGTAPLSYQWQKYSTPIPGATSATLTLSNVQTSDIGSYGAMVTNLAGFTYSNFASLAVAATAPTILTSPQTQTVAAGATTVFSVTASGTSPFTYQWTKNGTAIAGAALSTLTISSTQAADAGNYAAIVSNTAGAAISATAILSVSPGITTQPANASVVAGTAVTFVVAAAGGPPLTYQWLKNGSPIAGATSATYALSAAQHSDAANYSVGVTNAAGSVTSAPATLTVAAAPTAPAITAPPQSVAVTVGAGASFGFSANGTAPLSYQWQKNGAAIPAATGSTFVIANTQLSDAGSYTVVVTNSAGSATSAAAVLTVNASPPAIAAQPQDISVTVGSAASFSMAANGTTPFSYQWSRNAVPISGATSSTLTLPFVQLADAGVYAVTVSNSAGTAPSTPATLVVTAAIVAPSIAAHPQGANVFVGAGAAFSVTAAGSAPFAYQWQHDGVAVGGATSASFAIASAQLGDAGSYAVTVTNSAGSASSAPAILAVNVAAPSIVLQPQPNSLLAGSSATFSVQVSGTPPFAYQWSKNGTALSGASGPVFAIASAQAADAGNYAVTISNGAGMVASNPAALTIAAVIAAPGIAVQPQGSTAMAGAAAGFSVSATGTAPFSYQWYKDGAAISGAGGATFQIAAAQAGDAGNYTVTVSNSAGFVNSASAALVVNAASPSIVSQPQAASVVAGGSVTFTAVPGGSPPFAYQWFKNGVPISGATSSAMIVSPVGASNAGSYSVTVTNAAGSVTSGVALLTVLAGGAQPATLLANLSVRTTLAAGQKLIPGFVSSGPKTILLRVAGPSLTALGLGLSGGSDPAFEVFNGSSQRIAQNDDWNPALVATFNQVGAFVFTDAKDAALLTTVTGANSAIATGGGAGTVLLELYDTQADYSNRLVNVSARNQVGTGPDALIVGFVITGTGSKQLMIRGIGPGLAHYGITGYLADPYLEVFDSIGTRIAEVDDWSPALAATFTQVGAFGLDPGSKDAALSISLPAGVYSVKLSGRNNGTGEGLVEVYEVWP